LITHGISSTGSSRCQICATHRNCALNDRERTKPACHQERELARSSNCLEPSNPVGIGFDPNLSAYQASCRRVAPRIVKSLAEGSRLVASSMTSLEFRGVTQAGREDQAAAAILSRPHGTVAAARRSDYSRRAAQSKTGLPIASSTLSPLRPRPQDVRNFGSADKAQLGFQLIPGQNG
jgi:hypothetical protein